MTHTEDYERHYMALIDLNLYQAAIDFGSQLQDELVQFKEPIPGHISDVIAASRKLITLAHDKSKQAETARAFYIDQIKGAAEPIADANFPAGAAVTAQEFNAAIAAALNPAPKAPPAPATKEKVSK